MKRHTLKFRFAFAAIFVTAMFAMPVQATTLSFVVDPAQTGILLSGIYDGNAFPSGSLVSHSSALNGTILNGQSLSLDVIFANQVLARVFALAPNQLFFTIGIQTTANGYPGFPGMTTGFVRDESGAQMGSTQIGGGGMGDNGTIGIGVGYFTSADFGGAPVFHIGGWHLDTSLPTTGYTVTDVTLGFSFYNNVVEFGTIEQLPEPPSIALLPVGLVAVWILRRRQQVKSAAGRLFR